MKKIVLLMLSLSLGFSLVACGSDKKENEAVESVASAADDAVDAVEGAANDAVDAVDGATNDAVDALEGAASDAVDAVEGAAGDAVDGVQDIAGDVSNAVSNAFDFDANSLLVDGDKRDNATEEQFKALSEAGLGDIYVFTSANSADESLTLYKAKALENGYTEVVNDEAAAAKSAIFEKDGHILSISVEDLLDGDTKSIITLNVVSGNIGDLATTSN